MSGSISLILGGSLELILRPPPPDIVSKVTVRMGSWTATSWGPHMAYTLPSGMKTEVAVAYVDGHGNPATVDGDVTWASSNDTLVTVEVNSADSTRCMVTTAGPLGTSQVTATADADLGNGTRSLVTLLDFTVVAGEAVAGTISPVGDPTPAVA